MEVHIEDLIHENKAFILEKKEYEKQLEAKKRDQAFIEESEVRFLIRKN